MLVGTFVSIKMEKHVFSHGTKLFVDNFTCKYNKYKENATTCHDIP